MIKIKKIAEEIILGMQLKILLRAFRWFYSEPNLGLMVESAHR